MKTPLWRALLLSAVMMSGLSGSAVARPGIPAIPDAPDARCTLSAGSGEVNYGPLSRGQLTPLPGRQSLLTPGARSLVLTVTCPDTRELMLTMQGIPSAKGGGQLRYGDNGVILLSMTDASVDGEPVQLRTLDRTGGTGTRSAGSVSLMPGVSVVPVRQGKPVRGSVLTARLEMTPGLSDSSTRVAAPSTSDARFILELQP